MLVNTRCMNSTRGTSSNVPLVEFKYLVKQHVPLAEYLVVTNEHARTNIFTRMPGESYRTRLRSLLLYLCYVFRALINSLVCWFVNLTAWKRAGQPLTIQNISRTMQLHVKFYSRQAKTTRNDFWCWVIMVMHIHATIQLFICAADDKTLWVHT